MTSAEGADTTLTTTKLVVHDLEKTSAFYCGAYGFVERARVQAEIDGEPIDEILLGLPDEQSVPLILMKYVDRSAPPIGEVALVFMTGDIEALFERVRRHGGEIRVAPYQSDVTPFRAGFTVDPEGHLIENIERPA
jgi:catechol 2,3-dioxygenase-like lactoylglutathione lyase family enzyme